mmetsp:Transcript_16791/g.53160  ORF Transcript_16791/g.53160 Transcript_16791/m.53160 type:complete len:231 (+) Transcript_16791:1446-2138(+)
MAARSASSRSERVCTSAWSPLRRRSRAASSALRMFCLARSSSTRDIFASVRIAAMLASCCCSRSVTRSSSSCSSRRLPSPSPGKSGTGRLSAVSAAHPCTRSAVKLTERASGLSPLSTSLPSVAAREPRAAAVSLWVTPWTAATILARAARSGARRGPSHTAQAAARKGAARSRRRRTAATLASLAARPVRDSTTAAADTTSRKTAAPAAEGPARAGAGGVAEESTLVKL